MWLIPLGIAVIENKNPRMYWSATMWIDKDSYPVNRIVNKSTELDIVFGSTQLEQFEYLWGIEATFLQECILPYSDDVSSYFNQRQANPNTVSSNTTVASTRGIWFAQQECFWAGYGAQQSANLTPGQRVIWLSSCSIRARTST